MLASLTIANVRRIVAARIAPAPGINVLHGPNGSGKTSFLEAIHLLSAAKSFRTHKALDVITHGAPALTVAGVVKASPRNGPHALGVEKTARETRLKIDGEGARSASALASLLPVLVLDAEAYAVLDGGPSNRRALLDRTLFHVEPGYLAMFKSYHRALKQRNELLRQARPSRADAEFWEVELARQAALLDALRAECVERLNARLSPPALRDRIGAVAFQYHRGWKAGDNLEDLLALHWERDREIGSTAAGPHRADLRLLVEGRPGSPSLSRGQGKLVIAGLMAAQAQLIEERAGCRPVLLVDDLAAELDAEGRCLAASLLLSGPGQVFLTATDPEVLRTPLAGHEPALFHVERGVIDAGSTSR